MTTTEPEWVPGDIVQDAHGRVAFRRSQAKYSERAWEPDAEHFPWALIGGGRLRYKEDEDFARPLTVIYKVPSA